VSREEVRLLAVAAREAQMALGANAFRFYRDRVAGRYRYDALCGEEDRDWFVCFRLSSEIRLPVTQRVEMVAEMADILVDRLTHAVVHECPGVEAMAEPHLVRRPGGVLNWRGPIIWTREGSDARVVGSADVWVAEVAGRHDHGGKPACTRDEMAALAAEHGWHFDGTAGRDADWPDPPTDPAEEKD
jgi:hypothetical protein